MGKKPRSILPPAGEGHGKLSRAGRLTKADQLRALQYLPQAIEQGLSVQEYAKLAGIGETHARTQVREAMTTFRSRVGEQERSSLQAMQTAAQTARTAALDNFARVNRIITKRLEALELQKAPEATELAALARAVAVAWNGAKDATGLGFAEARASAKLREDSSTKAALVPDVHVEFMEAEAITDDPAD